MKALIFGVALCAASLPALAQTNVSVSIGQPGFYGRIDIGDYVPRPVVYAPQPVIITPAPHYVAEPVYLRVPPGHRKHWARFCGRYGACGRPVLFVRDEWYTNTYVPRYREHVGYRGDYRGGPRDACRRARRVPRRPRPPRRLGPRPRQWPWSRPRGHGKGHGHGHD